MVAGWLLVKLLPDLLLALVAALSVPLSRRRPSLFPVTLVLGALTFVAAVSDLDTPAAVARALWVAWPAPSAALALSAFGDDPRDRRPLLLAGGWLAFGAALAALRELPAVASLPEADRAAAWLWVYRASRWAGLTVGLSVARRPRTAAQAVAVLLQVSAAWDLVGWYAGDPWRSWSGARALACVTWAAVGAILLGWDRFRIGRPPRDSS